MIENFKEQNFGKYIRNKGVIQKYLILNWLSDVFANVQKATINFVLFVCPSIRSSARNDSATKEQSFWKLVLEYILKISL
jgi:hypothetical protein